MSLKGKTILLGVTGGIAAYKSVEVGRQFKKEGAEVIVVMTRGAREFISPLTFKSALQCKVFHELFEKRRPMRHIDLARKADLIVIAPATANLIAKLSAGMADDLLSTIILATRSPVLIAPAMNSAMFENRLVKSNLLKLEENGFHIVQPGSGALACGEVGKGRLAETGQIVEKAISLLNPTSDLAGKRLLITAGPTIEKIDPVRAITNLSTGRMGYSIAEQAVSMGAGVTLISGPTNLPAPEGCKVIRVESADDMLSAVRKEFRKCDCFISTAAVSDYKPVYRKEKIKKTGKRFFLELKENPDILKAVSGKKGKRIIVAFSIETCNAEDNALRKMREKKADFMILNSPKAIGAEKSRCIIYSKNGRKILPFQSKHETATTLLESVSESLTYLL